MAQEEKVSEVQDNTEVHLHFEEFKEELLAAKTEAPAVVEFKLKDKAVTPKNIYYTDSKTNKECKV